MAKTAEAVLADALRLNTEARAVELESWDAVKSRIERGVLGR